MFFLEHFTRIPLFRMLVQPPTDLAVFSLLSHYHKHVPKPLFFFFFWKEKASLPKPLGMVYDLRAHSSGNNWHTQNSVHACLAGSL